MKDQILNVGTALSKAQLQQIKGGEGNYVVYCNDGGYIENAPDCSSATTTRACGNKGGFKGFCLVFEDVDAGN